jgi:hypothetical protein
LGVADEATGPGPGVFAGAAELFPKPPNFDPVFFARKTKFSG